MFFYSEIVVGAEGSDRNSFGSQPSHVVSARAIQLSGMFFFFQNF